MSTTRVETLPATWDDACDLPFFRITARLFSADFCLGAGVLLASYDDDVPDTVGTAVAGERRTRTATPASPVSATSPERRRVPTQTRRTR
jgi:hypothetical protein